MSAGKKFLDRPYRPGVGVMLLNRDNLVFVGQRIDQVAEAWQMPQGGIDPGETPLAAALRELQEEIGTDKAVVVAESRDWICYDLPPALADRIWKGRYRGQKQKWFALRFTGRDEDVNLDTDHPEFKDWRWVDFDELVGLIVPFKRDAYRRLIDEFRHLAD